MALALTITRDTYDAAHASDPQVEIDGYIAWDNSYPANGEPLTVAIVNTALAAARHSGCTVSAINNVLVEPPIDRSILPVWDSSNGKVIAYAKGAAATLTVVTTTPVSVASHVSDALPAGTVAPVSVKILTAGGGGATGVCNLTPAAPATTLDAQWDPATRKVTFLAADNAATCAVQALVWTANTSSYLAEITGATDLSAATYNCRIRIIATKTA